MSDKQKKELKKILQESYSITFHHGDCIGADEEADEIAKCHFYSITIHPPRDNSRRAFCKPTGGNDLVLKERDYLKRNHDIVNACDILIAAPKSDKEELRSGTWATVRYARKMGKEVIILER